MRRRTPTADVVDLGDLDPLHVRRALVLEAAGVPGDHVEALAAELGVTELELRAWLVAHEARADGLDVGAELDEWLARQAQRSPDARGSSGGGGGSGVALTPEASGTG